MIWVRNNGNSLMQPRPNGGVVSEGVDNNGGCVSADWDMLFDVR